MQKKHSPRTTRVERSFAAEDDAIAERLIASVGAAIVLGSAIEILLYRNLRRLNASQTTTFLASMGLATAGIALILLFLRSNPRALNGMPNISHLRSDLMKIEDLDTAIARLTEYGI